MQAQMPYTASATGRNVIPIVPYAVKGRFRSLKTAILTLAFAVYYLLPWLPWHGQQRTGQLILIDLPRSRLQLFDLTLYPQDLMVLMGLMVLAAAMLFYSAAMLGRAFCGFFCFQTLWTDAFRMIETWVQGPAQARLRLMKQPWSLDKPGLEKLAKLGLTHLLWLLLAVLTALTFTFYFSPPGVLIASLLDGSAPYAAYTTIAVLTATTYVAAGIAREDICRVACPYGKFQSVMQDTATRTVHYDAQRGERSLGRKAPTAAFSSKANSVAGTRERQGYGDCIDCGYCVKVCPTGVDIRKGFQIDCISCGLCIDACDQIMRSVNLPTGLIRYARPDTQPAAAATATVARADSLPARAEATPLVKAADGWSQFRRHGYLAIILLSAVFIAYQLMHLQPFSAVTQQQAQPLVMVMSNGDLKSRYSVRITNKSAATEHYTISMQGLPPGAITSQPGLTVPAGKTYQHSMSLLLTPQQASALSSFRMTITPISAPHASQQYQLGYINR
ncbi:cytochrome c oxidase accessory protein CcoG [Methylobacillus flagellatus]|uniref:cytochrome c oxidase accessory protein CcoG n=1 Tax=Methylobacillus flagellatus TaxID=405 RepID=UPI0010F5C575|nr:cytochrome c oxidase accessory protein CcoG [Methylobacillus flagellatus]